MNQLLYKKTIVFLSSKATNLAFDVAQACPEYEICLIMDKKIPLDLEEEYLGNFYIHFFDKEKIFFKNKEKYFDLLAMYLLDFEPDLIVCSNYFKLLSQGFIDFVNFRNSQTQIINVHHGDLRILDTNSNTNFNTNSNTNYEMKYAGLDAWKRQFIEEKKFCSTLHFIEDKGMDTGRQLSYSEYTSFDEIKELELIKNMDEIESLRIANVILHYHEQSKVLEILVGEVKKLLDRLSEKLPKKSI